ncbi:lysostaphin resistance A-like protein [Brevundimonas sp.]|uniref:CPBP family intramembrane glutamic endopeptidase n=1 Tax=Brevundimonas sp. TaxID=1871086 RepID=UPI003569E5D6
MTARRLSQFLALALAALTFWVLISRPGVVDPQFAVEIHVAILLFVAAIFGISFVALRFGAGGSTTFWTVDRADQVRPILWMELATLTAMLSADGVFHWLGQASPASAEISYLLAGTLVPAAFLQFGLVTWPSRSSRPGRLRLLIIAGLAIGLAAAWTYGAYSSASDKSVLPQAPDLIVTVGAVILGATFEEIVFRVLLLTALLDRTGSRFQAVFLSSVAFGLMHVPGALLDPVLHGDWAFLQQVAFEYAPEFLMQTFIGLLLGVLWLRSGSITLIAATHAILNLGNAMAYGLLAYG